MDKINIIGYGLAGVMVAARLRDMGREFTIFDPKLPGNATGASENLIIESWYDPEPLRESLNFLNAHFPVQKIQFQNQISASFVHPSAFTEPFIAQKVKIVPEGVTTDTRFYPGRNIVCAGYWVNQLLQTSLVKGKTGHTINYFGTLPQNHLAMYKPYRHEKLFQFEPGIIKYGNSVSILHDSYIKRYVELTRESMTAARKLLPSEQFPMKDVVAGIRPEAGNGLVTKVKNHIILTGGGKSSMFLYPLLSKTAVEML